MTTLLQNDSSGRMNHILTRIAEYGMRFPVATIAAATEYHKGTISKILSGKSEITDAFIRDFDQAFPPKTEATLKQPVVEADKKSNFSREELFEQWLMEKEARRQEAEARLQKEEDRYDKLFVLLESNLRELYNKTLDIMTAQHVGAAYQMFWIDRWAEKEAAGDEEKAKSLAKAYGKAVAEKLSGKKEKSTP